LNKQVQRRKIIYVMIPYQKKPPATFPTEPDNELLTWEKWITIRKEETTALGKHTRRPPADLVMNLYENVRPDKERKIVLEEAKINEKVGVRDSLWEQALRLKQKCYCEPVYEVQRTAAEMGRPSIIEHVDVPTEIKVNELGYTGVHRRINYNYLDSEYQKYREKREKELEEKILKIDPFRYWFVFVIITPTLALIIVVNINNFLNVLDYLLFPN
jgi:hypothetical protein